MYKFGFFVLKGKSTIMGYLKGKPAFKKDIS